MAKKRKKQKVVVNSELAKKALQNQHYREAIKFYKILIKKENNEEYRLGLTESYQGRANQLQAKGMFKEALVVWDNLFQLAPTDSFPLAYFSLLCQLNRYDEAIQRYVKQFKGDPKAQNQFIFQEKIASLCIAGQWDLVQKLPDDDMVKKHSPYAKAALEDYCQGKQPDFKKIPFRSPFRDFASILKALILFKDDPERATKSIQRIDDKSAFSNLKKVALMAFSDDLKWLKESTEIQQFVATFKGWSQQRINLAKLPLLHNQDNLISKLLNQIKKNKWHCHLDWLKITVRQLCFAQDDLPYSFEFEQSQIKIERFDILLIKAWFYEIDFDNSIMEKVERWDAVIDELTSIKEDLSHKAALQVALIQKHIVSLIEKSQPEMLFEEDLSKEIIGRLEFLLQFYPKDKDTILKLVKLYREKKKLAKARKHLDFATRQWKDDADVLMATIETALASQAYKKAGRLTKQLLVLDPINTQAKQIMFDSSLAHTKKLIAKQSFDLAKKELENTNEWAYLPVLKGRYLAYKGVLEYQLKNKESSLAYLQQSLDTFGGNLYAQAELSLILEENKINSALFFPKSIVKKYLKGKLKVDQKLTLDILLTLCRWFNALDKTVIKNHHSAIISPLIGILKRAKKQPKSIADFDFICTTWHHIEQEELRLIYAKIAAKKWTEQACFKWHIIDANFLQSGRKKLTNNEINQLNTIERLAMQQGDNKTVQGIQKLMKQSEPSFLVPDGLEEMDIELMRMLLENLDPHIREQLSNAAEEEDFETFDRLLHQQLIKNSENNFPF